MNLRLRAKRLLRSDLARAVAFQLALFGIATGVLEGWQLKAKAGVVLLLALPITTMVVKWFRAGGQFPSSALEELLPVRKHQCKIPADVLSINGACRLAERHFGSSNIRQSEIIGMYERNPYALVTLRCDETVVAYADFFVLDLPHLNDLRLGDLDEASMRADMTLGPEEFCQVRSLYLGGIVVKEPRSGHGGRRAPILLWAACKLLLAKYLNDDRDVNLYAEGFSEEGIALLEKLDFDCIDAGSGRKSGDPLYSRTINRSDIRAWLASHADWGSICDLRIDGDRPALPGQ